MYLYITIFRPKKQSDCSVKDFKKAVNYSLKGSKTLVKSRFLDLFLQKHWKDQIFDLNAK